MVGDFIMLVTWDGFTKQVQMAVQGHTVILPAKPQRWWTYDQEADITKPVETRHFRRVGNTNIFAEEGA